MARKLSKAAAPRNPWAWCPGADNLAASKARPDRFLDPSGQCDPSGDTAQLNSVSCPASRVCIAVGDSGTHSLLAERWDGSAWALTPTP